MAVCGFCNRELTEENFAFCPHCGRPVRKPANQDSLPALAQKSRRWYRDIASFPSVIAHEYDRLQQLCAENSPYGALLEIRDLYETLLKFEILIVCAYAKHTGDGDFFRNVGCDITTPNPSLGLWHQIGKNILEFYTAKESAPPGSLIHPLETLLKRYEKLKIISWRNESIGHGALGYGEDSGFLAEITEHVDHFKSIFESIGEDLKKQCLMAGDEELTGPGKARRLPSESTLRLRLLENKDDNDPVFDITPFVCLLSDEVTREDLCSVFFFNNQSARIRASDMLSYPSGVHRMEKLGYFQEINRMRTARSTKADLSRNILGTMTEQDEELLDRIWFDCMFYTYVDPEPLSSWLRGCIENHSSGAFCLMMERGTGKSTFCENLNGLISNPYVLSPDLDVRVLHMERSLVADHSLFEMGIENLWRKSYGGAYLANLRPISHYRSEDRSGWDALLLFLEQCRQSAWAERGKKKILMVIDGLDEITDERIWDYLPCNAEYTVPENVYVLLTSRTVDNDDLPLHTVHRLQTIRAYEIGTWDRSTESYIGFLRDFINSTPLSSLPSEAKTELIRASDYRILFLGMILKLVESGLAADDVKDTDSMVSMYLARLDALYGEKESAKLKELLYIIGVYGEKCPLTMQEIADLCWTDGIITIDLVSKIADIAPLLHLWHGMAGDRPLTVSAVSFANPGLTSSILRRLENGKSYRDPIREKACRYLQECLASRHADGADSYSWTALRIIGENQGTEGFEAESVLCYLAYLEPWISRKNGKQAAEILVGMQAGHPDPHDPLNQKILLALARVRILLREYEEARDLFTRMIRGADETDAAQIPLLFHAETGLIRTLCELTAPAKEIRTHLNHAKKLLKQHESCFAGGERQTAWADWNECALEYEYYKCKAENYTESYPNGITHLIHKAARHFTAAVNHNQVPDEIQFRAHSTFGAIDRIARFGIEHSRKACLRLAEQQYLFADRILRHQHESDPGWRTEQREETAAELDSLKLAMIKKWDPEALASFLDSSEASGTHRKISPDTLMELAFRFCPADEQLLREAIKRYLEIMEYGKLQPRQYANILKAIHASADWTDLLTEEDLCAIIREAAVYQKDRICAIDVFSNSFSALSSLGDWKTQAKEMEKLMKNSEYFAAASLVRVMYKECWHSFFRKGNNKFKIPLRMLLLSKEFLLLVAVSFGASYLIWKFENPFNAIIDWIRSHFSFFLGGSLAAWGFLITVLLILLFLNRKNRAVSPLKKRLLPILAFFSKYYYILILPPIFGLISLIFSFTGLFIPPPNTIPDNSNSNMLFYLLSGILMIIVIRLFANWCNLLRYCLLKILSETDYEAAADNPK